MRRRAASAASTMRARDARSSSRASALASACAVSSANAAMRCSTSGGKGSGLTLETISAPQRSPSTKIGAPTDARKPSSSSIFASSLSWPS